jgi:hypothetical protein
MAHIIRCPKIEYMQQHISKIINPNKSANAELHINEVSKCPGMNAQA